MTPPFPLTPDWLGIGLVWGAFLLVAVLSVYLMLVDDAAPPALPSEAPPPAQGPDFSGSRADTPMPR